MILITIPTRIGLPLSYPTLSRCSCTHLMSEEEGLPHCKSLITRVLIYSMKAAASTTDLNIPNHQHAFTHSTTPVSHLLRLQFLLPQLKTQVSCSVANLTFSLVSSPIHCNPPHQPLHSGAPSSCTSGGCLASGHRVFQSLLSSIQHQVPFPSISQAVHFSYIVSFCSVGIPRQRLRH